MENKKKPINIEEQLNLKNKTNVKDYNIDNTPWDFSSLIEKDDVDLKTIFPKSRKRKLYIYPLNNLIKGQKNEGIRFSPNVVKIGFIDLEQVIVLDAFETTNANVAIDARASANPNDQTIEYAMTDQKSFVFQNQELYDKYHLHVLSINEPASKDNLDNLYIVDGFRQEIKANYLVTTKETDMTKVKDFKIRGTNPIIVRIQKQLPENTKITALTIKLPKTALIGNVKCYGDINGSYGYSRLIIEEDKVLFPLYMMPIETNPAIRLLPQWMTNFVLPWKIAKKFIKPKSVLDLIKIGDITTNTRKQVIKNARVTKALLAKEYNKFNKPEWPLKDDQEIKDKEVWIYNKGTRPGFGGGTSYTYYGLSTTNKFSDVEIEIKDSVKITSLQEVLLNMLNYTYNYKTNFKHATYGVDSSKHSYGLPTNSVAKLKEEKFVGQKPEIVISNLLEEWLFENPKYTNHSEIQVLKQIILMLSENIYSELSINKGENDDYKILLPFYFELVSKPIEEDGEYKFKDIVVILKSEYFDFLDNGDIKLKNNDISQNPLFKLSQNQFNWLPLIESIEAVDIPSLLPKDIKLSDGNYGKNFVNMIIETSKIENSLNYYGKKTEDLFNKTDWSEISLSISKVKFNLKISTSISQIEISAIFGSGYYDFELETEQKEKIQIDNIKLFGQENNSLIKIEV